MRALLSPLSRRLRERLRRARGRAGGGRVGVALTAPVDMSPGEALLLYGLVRGRRPLRALEIGAFRGGSGQIIASAMEDLGAGHVVGIDPEPQFEVSAAFHGRYTLLRGTSPERVGEAVERLGGKLDFVLIDGLHTHSAVARDLAAVVPHLADDGCVLLHDAYHFGISAAVDAAVREHALVDCGIVSRTPTLDADPWIAYGGLRLLRARPIAGADAILAAYDAQSLARPRLAGDVLEHDVWHCRAVSPCARCRAESGATLPA